MKPQIGVGFPQAVQQISSSAEPSGGSAEVPKNTTPPESRICCKCGKNDVWRIELRDCPHMLCISCSIVYLRWAIQDKEKARIKCPKKNCAARMHENDIRALLDPMNEDLSIYMQKEQREWLQHKHDQDVIIYGLGGKDLARQCPLCLNFYGPESGCNYVRCPNMRCNTWFCWICSKPVKSWQHFTQTECKVGADDLWKVSYLMRFLVVTSGCVLVLISPIIAFLILTVLPWVVTCGIPYVTIKKWHARLYEGDRLPTKQEFKGFLLKSVICAPFLVAFSLILGPFSLCFAIPMFCAYVGLAFIKCIPPFSNIFKMLEMIGCILGILGLGNWKKLVKDSKDARYEIEVEKRQDEQEKSERVNVDEMTPEQMSQKKAMDEATNARIKKGYQVQVKPLQGGVVQVAGLAAGKVGKGGKLGKMAGKR